MHKRSWISLVFFVILILVVLGWFTWFYHPHLSDARLLQAIEENIPSQKNHFKITSVTSYNSGWYLVVGKTTDTDSPYSIYYVVYQPAGWKKAPIVFNPWQQTNNVPQLPDKLKAQIPESPY